MTNFKIELYKAVLSALKSIHPQSEPCVDIRTGEFLLMIGDDGQVCGLSNRGGIEFDYNKKYFLTYADMLDKVGKSQDFVRILLDNSWKAISAKLEKSPFASPKNSEFGQTIVQIESDKSSKLPDQKIIGKTTIRRKTQSCFFANEKKKLFKEIENLTNDYAENTNKQSTIDKAGEIYDRACEIANTKGMSNQFRELEKIKDNLEYRFNQQERLKSRKINDSKNTPMKRFKIYFVAISISIIIMFVVGNYFYKKYYPVIEKAKIEITEKFTGKELKSFKSSTIEFMITKSKKDLGLKISDWRTGYILKTCSNEKYKNQKELLHKIIELSKKEKF